MKILMVLTSSFPPDSRVEKEAISLFEDGHEIHIVCFSNGVQPNYEKTDFCEIHRLDFSSFFRNKLSALALILPFFFNKWKRSINKLYLKYEFDVIHIHDLPLSKVGYYFKKKYNCKLVCDQHEFYSNWITKTAHMNSRLGKIISKLSNWEKYERKYLNLANLVITVAKPLEINYKRKYQIKNIITVPNTPTKRIFNKQNINNEIIEKYKDSFILFYAGGIDILRGIETAIVALKELKKEIPNVKLLLCGIVIKPYNPFKTAEKYGVSDQLEFIGWVDEELLPSYMAASNVCFFTPPANRDEINKTIATKIYQYAIMQKPIIVSDAKMMKDFVEQNNLGISIRTNNSTDFTGAVIKIYNNESMYYKKDINENWLWEKTVSPLIYNYKKL
jgi:glycosyltransferase involved in cell wall biosynthesis